MLCLFFLEGPPDSPINLTSTNVTANSIVLQWYEGFNGNRPVFKFSVKVKENGEPYNCTPNPRADGFCLYAYRNVTFSRLKAFTTYSFTVCSINSIGETCTNGSFNVTTKEDGLSYISYNFFT